MHVYRLRVLLRARRPLRLPAYHAAALYGLLAAANAENGSARRAVPDGLLLDAVERARTIVRKGESYAFGFTLLASDPNRAAARLERVRRGLVALGERKPSRGPKPVFGGNYELVSVEDLVAGHAWSGGVPRPIPPRRFDEEAEALARHPELTIHLVSPIRLRRRRQDQRAGHRHFDELLFDAATLCGRALRRLRRLGLLEETEASLVAPAGSIETHENGLVWLDFGYGPRAERKAAGGALGRVRIATPDPALHRALVLGQYLRVGQGTRFGFGAYRIAELGDDPWPCPRAQGLLDGATRPAAVDLAAEEHALEPAELSSAARALRDGALEPQTPARLRVGDGPDARLLSVPPRRDRALQRLVLREIGPALDRFFEDSSLGYRKGLGRRRAARRVADAFKAGFRWALHSDFRRFFDSIDHRLLEDRLSAYLGDRACVDAIMAWMRAGAPEFGRGLPTGSPLSPLLANVFLDRFDEEIERAGGRLVRYADDFFVLTRTEEDARAMFAAATEAAESLLLALNEEKTATVRLDAPFEFLGFRFERRGDWRAAPRTGPRAIEDLGWKEARPAPPAHDGDLRLAGEGGPADASRACVIVGPRVARLKSHGDRLVVSYQGGRADVDIAWAQVRELVVLGKATIAGKVVDQLLRRRIPAVLADDSGRVAGLLAAPGDYVSHDALRGLVRAADDEDERLAFARALIEAKLANHAALADACGDGEDAAQLRTMAAQARDAPRVGALRGLEGAAAALWYRGFERRIARPFRFERRVAPNAEDPVNVLLNIGQTVLHRHCALALAHAGLPANVGLYHTARAGHAALASDLQEPFRHLIDRAVIEATRLLAKSDFERRGDGPPHLRIRWQASRRFAAHVHEVLARPCLARGDGDRDEPFPYREHIWKTARAWRRCLARRDAKRAWASFHHPDDAPKMLE